MSVLFASPPSAAVITSQPPGPLIDMSVRVMNNIYLATPPLRKESLTNLLGLPAPARSNSEHAVLCLFMQPSSTVAKYIDMIRQYCSSFSF